MSDGEGELVTPVFGDQTSLDQNLPLSWPSDSSGETSGCSWVSSKGEWRPLQEDRFVHTGLKAQGRPSRYNLSAVFDGHGGAEVAH